MFDWLRFVLLGFWIAGCLVGWVFGWLRVSLSGCLIQWVFEWLIWFDWLRA